MSLVEFEDMIKKCCFVLFNLLLQTAVFMGCMAGEIELGLSNDTQVRTLYNFSVFCFHFSEKLVF